ncbi:MAG: hypothetical protein ACNA8W_21835 [Bradymonadaceae bacterium]
MVKWTFFVILMSGSLIFASSATAQETLFDPENPAFDEPEDIEEIEDIEEREPREVFVESPAFSSAGFLGRYSSALFVDTSFDGGGEDIVELASELYLQLDYDISRQTRVFVSGRFTHWLGGKENPDQTNLLINAAGVRTHYEALLDEAYVRHRPGSWTLTVGNLRTPWGSTDIMRPGDVINAADIRSTAGFAGGTGALVPQLTGMANYSTSSWSLTALVVPFFVPNRVSAFGRDSSLANPRNPLIAEQMPVLLVLEQAIDPSRHDDFQPVIQATRRPHDTPSGASAGLRATTTVANTDLGLGGFYGWDRTPWMYMDEDMRELLVLMVSDGQVLEDFDFMGFVRRNPEVLRISGRLSSKAEAGEELFFSEYRRRATFLVDAARYVGPIGVRADVAFSPARTFFTTDLQPERRSSVFAALGLSYEILDEDAPLAVIVEGFALYPFARDSALNRFFVPEDQRGDDAELAIIGDGYYGVASAVMWGTPLWDLELQVGGLYSISGEDWLGTAALTKPWQGWLRTTVGVAYFDGPDPADKLTLGGLYRHNDEVFFAIDGTF